MTDGTIDVHHHYLTEALIGELARIGVHQVGGQRLAASRPEESLAVMERHGIESALLSAPFPLPFDDATRRRVARSLNEAGAGIVAGAPERFGLLAALPLPDVDGALAEIDHAFDELDADGVMLLSNYSGIYLGDGSLEPVFAELDRRGCVVLLHPTVFTGAEPAHGPNAGSPVPTLEPSLFEFVFDTTRAVANLVIGGTLRRHPNVAVIVAHAGGTVPFVCDRIVDRGPILRRVQRAQQGEAPPPTPDELRAMLGAALADSRRELQRLFYDLTLSANETVLGCLERFVPGSQIVLGTDFPMAQEIGVVTTLERLEAHRGFDEDERREITTGNPARLFPRLGALAATTTQEEWR
jgi:6-methylsalicylate decarboxylase